MVKSMTGYGGAKGVAEGLSVTVELKSVNNRFLDTSVRLPRSFLFAEEALKSTVAARVSRGKVDVFVTVDSSKSDDVVVTVNEPLARAYLEAVTSIGANLGVAANVTALDVARFPEVLSVEKKEADKEALSAALCTIMNAALDEFDAMRCREGEKLQEDILSRLDTIEGFVSFIEERSPQTVTEYRARLEQRMREVLENTALDEGRILQEAAIFADRTAVAEETVRLRSHISQLREMLSSGVPTGRKLDFLIQEFNRESNTIGSKCNDGEIARIVVDLKAEIEKIREQVQNIE